MILSARTLSVLRRASVALASCALILGAVRTPVRAADTESRMPSFAAAPSPATGYRLHLVHLHTGETLNVIYKTGNEYSSEGLAKLNHFLRDHRTQDTANYDPLEFDLLHKLLATLGRPNAEIDIVCGYRTPQSNSFLRTRSAVTGVAEHSQHMLSKAIDIRIPGVSTLALRNAALSLGMGGVGYYPTSQFVHVDVGPVREWSFGATRNLQTASNHLRGHRRHSRNV